MADDLIKVDIVADYDDKGAKAAKADLEAIDGTTAEAEVSVDDNASRVTGKVDSDLDAIDGTTAKATVKVDDDASAVTGDVDADLEAIDGTTARATVTVDDDASAVTGDVDADLGAIDGTTARATVTVDDDASAVTGDVSGDLEAIDGKQAKATVDVDGDTTAANIRGDLQAIDGKTARATVSADADAGTTGLIASIGGLPGRITGLYGDLRKMAAAGGPIAAVAGAFIGAATEASNVALEADGIADFTGTSVENASALAAVLRDNTTIEAADLYDIIAQVTGALASNPALLDQLGISMDTVRQGPFATFIAAVDAWNGGQLSANDRMVIGAQLFGEEGLRQISSLTSALDTDLATAIAGVSENRIITDEDVENAREIKSQMADLSGQLQGIAVSVGSEVLPVVADILGQLEDAGGLVNDIASLGQEATGRSVFDWIEQFPSQKFTDLYDGLTAAGVSAEDFRNNMFDLNDVMALLEAGIPADVIDSANLTADAQKYLSEQMTATEEAATEEADAIIESTSAHENAIKAIDDTIARLEAEAEAQREAAEASEEAADALLSANDVYYANQDAIVDARDALDNYNEVVADAESSAEDQREALRDVAKAADDLAQSEVDLARQQATANGVTLSGTEALDIQNHSLITQAAQMNGPTRAALIAHIGRLNDIPDEVISQIIALIEQGKINEAERLLNDTSRTRTATMRADNDQYAYDSTNAELDYLARDRQARIVANMVAGAISGVFNVFGSAMSLGSVVGSATPAAAPAALTTGGGGDTYNLNLPRGTRVEDTVRALDRHARRNGRRPYAFR